jgi:di/tricarboxylate transporter
MTLSIALMLLILAAALVLFSLERIPADVVALGILLTLILTGLLPADRAFAGFGSDAAMMILGLLILSAALFRTGVVEITGRAIVRRTGNNPNRLLFVIMAAAGVVSSFISNTGATAFFLPVVLGISRRSKVSPSRLLMPLAFASILAGSVTLVGTSTNIVVSGLMTQSGMKPLGMFELTPIGLPILVVGIAYMYFIGSRLVPERDGKKERQSSDGATYLTEVMILPNSAWAGKKLAETDLREGLSLEAVRVVRDKTRYLAPKPELQLREGDVLLVEGPTEQILQVKTTAGIDIKADFKLANRDVEDPDNSLAEAIVLFRSPLESRTLKEFQFRERFGVRVLAIQRRSETIRRKISKVPLQIGDVLLIEGNRYNINALEEENVLRVISALEGRIPNQKNAPIAILCFIVPILLAAFNLISFPVAVLLGVLVIFMTRTLSPQEAYRQVEWRAVILIGSMLGLGVALESTGTAEFIAQHIVGWFGQANPLWLLSIFFALTVLLTQPMSNQAAAVVVAPIAFQTAAQLGLNPRTFAIMITLAASTSYITPLEPSCLMVYGPGNYRFIDFIKVGSLLSLIIYILAITTVPLIWPLF